MNIQPTTSIRNPLAATPQGGPPATESDLPEVFPVDLSAPDRLTLTALPGRVQPDAGIVDKVKAAKEKEPLAGQQASTAEKKAGAAQDKGSVARQEVAANEPRLQLSEEEKAKRAREREELRQRALSTLPKPFLEQEAAMVKLLADGKGPFTNTAGATQEVAIAKDGDKSLYEVTIRSKSFEVTVAADLDTAALLARVLDFYTKTPEHLRGNLKSIKLETMLNPTDADWAKVYGRDTFISAGTAGGSSITFWGLKERPQNLAEGTFNHELGHLIGEKLATSNKAHATMIPPGWEEAARADGNRVSDYAGMNPNEDFAETWEDFLAAHKDPEKLKAFQEKYPNRSKILEVIHQSREDQDKVKMSEVKKDVQRMLKNEGIKDA